MRYYIADLHFCHSRLNEHMDKRGFESVEAMNVHMINRWNSKVRKNDDVIILGDFCMSKDADEVNAILASLYGNKYLIIGNHDHYISSRKFDKSAFKWIEPYMELSDNKRKVILSHYPVMCYNGQYRRNGEGAPITYMLYGHVHNTFDEYLINEHINRIRQYQRPVFGADGMQGIPCNMINCFCMFSDYVPLTLDEWIRVDAKRRAGISIDDYDVTEAIEDEG